MCPPAASALAAGATDGLSPAFCSVTVVSCYLATQDKVFEVLEGDQLQPYMDAIELEGNAAQPMEEAGVEEEKAS